MDMVDGVKEMDDPMARCYSRNTSARSRPRNLPVFCGGDERQKLCGEEQQLEEKLRASLDRG